MPNTPLNVDPLAKKGCLIGHIYEGLDEYLVFNGDGFI